MELEWRRATVADAPALAALADSVSEPEAAAYLSTAEGCVCSNAGTVMAFAGVQQVDPARMQGRLLADPALSGADAIGRLLDWQETRARTAGCTWFELLTPNSSSAVTTIAQLRPWEVSLPLWEMERRNGDPIPTTDLPAGLTAVRYTPDLESALYRCYQEVYTDQRMVLPHSRQTWSEILKAAAFRPDLSTLAVDKAGNVVAFVLSFAHPPTWNVGPVGTLAKWRRRGLSSALLATTLKAAGADPNLNLAILTVDGASPTGAMRIYKGFGFTTTRTWQLFRENL